MISELLRLVIKGLPPSVNHTYKTGRNGNRFKRPEVSKWQEDTAGKIREAWNEEIPYEGYVEVRVLFTVKGKRRWDIDNRLKALLDCLELAGVIRDDSQIWGISAHKEYGETDKVELLMMEYTIAMGASNGNDG